MLSLNKIPCGVGGVNIVGVGFIFYTLEVSPYPGAFFMYIKIATVKVLLNREFFCSKP